MMVPMIQLDLDEPGAVRLALHRMSRQMPVIEITGQMDLFSFRRNTDEVDRLGHLLGGIAMAARVM